MKALEKMDAVAKFLDVNRWLVERLKGNVNVFKFHSEEYLVLTTEEAGEYETDHRASCLDAVAHGDMEDFDDDQRRGDLLAVYDGREHRFGGFYIYRVQ